MRYIYMQFQSGGKLVFKIKFNPKHIAIYKTPIVF